MKRCKGLVIGLILITILTFLCGCKPAEPGFSTYIDRELNKVIVSNITYEAQENIVISIYLKNKKIATVIEEEFDSFENIEIDLSEYLSKEKLENKNISVNINKTVSRDWIAIIIIFSTIGSIAIIVFIILLLIAKKEYNVNKGNWG